MARVKMERVKKSTVKEMLAGLEASINILNDQVRPVGDKEVEAWANIKRVVAELGGKTNG